MLRSHKKVSNPSSGQGILAYSIKQEDTDLPVKRGRGRPKKMCVSFNSKVQVKTYSQDSQESAYLPPSSQESDYLPPRSSPNLMLEHDDSPRQDNSSPLVFESPSTSVTLTEVASPRSPLSKAEPSTHWLSGLICSLQQKYKTQNQGVKSSPLSNFTITRKVQKEPKKWASMSDRFTALDKESMAETFLTRRWLNSSLEKDNLLACQGFDPRQRTLP